jgi:hypothetical protein
MWVGWASTPSLIWAWPTPMAMTAMTMDKNVFFIWLMFLWLVFVFASKLQCFNYEFIHSLSHFPFWPRHWHGTMLPKGLSRASEPILLLLSSLNSFNVSDAKVGRFGYYSQENDGSERFGVFN